nr:hypothetical protein [Tanacetum cinerariifolium]
MSDSKDSTVTYATVSSPCEGRSGDVSPGVDGPPEPEQASPSPVYIPYVPEPEYPEYIPPEDEVFPDPEDDDDEDPEEDPANYLADQDDEEEEEPSRDDADEEDEEQDEDDDDEEEEHPASADSIPPPPVLPSPPILLIPLLAASPPLQLLSSDHRADRPEVTLPPRKRVTELVAVQEQDTQDIYGVIEDTQGRQTEIFQRVEALVDDSQYHYETGRLVDQEAIVFREAWAHSIELSSAVHFELQGYMTHTWVQDQRIHAPDTLIATLTTQLSSLQEHLAMALGENRALQTREQARTSALEGAGSST